MTTPEQSFSLEIYNSLPAGLIKFLYLPDSYRSRLISECLIRAKEDADYFLSEGTTVENYPVGTVLPSGNTILEDEKGRRYFRSPIPKVLRLEGL